MLSLKYEMLSMTWYDLPFVGSLFQPEGTKVFETGLYRPEQSA